jgi:hypothetical protein
VTQQPPTQPGPPAWGQPPPNPQPRPSYEQPPRPAGQPTPPWYRRGWVLFAAGLVVGLVLGSAIGSADPTQPTGRRGRTAATTPAATDAAPEVTSVPATDPPAVVPKAKDFTLIVKVLSKKCFGSAGCSLTYRVDAGWPDGLDPDVEYEVIYEVRGGEDGPQINTMTVQGDSYERSQEESISTSSAGKRLTAVATSVEEA